MDISFVSSSLAGTVIDIMTGALALAIAVTGALLLKNSIRTEGQPRRFWLCIAASIGFAILVFLDIVSIFNLPDVPAVQQLGNDSADTRVSSAIFKATVWIAFLLLALLYLISLVRKARSSHKPTSNPVQEATLANAIPTETLPGVNTQQILAQKNEMLGAFMAHIIHEINNILTIILANTEMAQLKLDEDSSARQNLQKAEQAVGSSRKLLQLLSSYASRKQEDIHAFDFTHVATETLELMGKLLPRSISLVRDLPVERILVSGRKIEIQQVMLNFFANSISAIGSGSGEITVTLARVKESNGQRPEDARCKLTFSDTGSGIEEAHMSRVFEAYFTTKKLERSSGLGLTIAKAIIEDMKGEISLCSEPEQSARFSVILPVVLP